MATALWRSTPSQRVLDPERVQAPLPVPSQRCLDPERVQTYCLPIPSQRVQTYCLPVPSQRCLSEDPTGFRKANTFLNYVCGSVWLSQALLALSGSFLLSGSLWLSLGLSCSLWLSRALSGSLWLSISGSLLCLFACVLTYGIHRHPPPPRRQRRATTIASKAKCGGRKGGAPREARRA